MSSGDVNITIAGSFADKCVLKDDPFGDAKLFNFALTLFISVFGLISNSMVIFVNRKIRTLSSSDICITLLAVTDNILIISVSLFSYRYVYRHLPGNIEESPESIDWRTSVVVTLFGLIFKNFAHCLNTYTIVLLNVDRYIQVKFLARSRTWCTPRRAVIHFICAVIWAVIFTLPKIIEHITLIQDPDEHTAHCHGYFKITGGIGADFTYKLVYGTVGYAIVMYVIPLGILTVTNITLIKVVNQRRMWLKKSSSELSTTKEGEKMKRNQISAIITLLAVTIIFMVCQSIGYFFNTGGVLYCLAIYAQPQIQLKIPDVVLQFMWKLAPKYGPITNMFAYQILIINSSVNFIIYAISSRVFRRRLCKLLARKSSEDTSISAIAPQNFALSEYTEVSHPNV